MIMKDELLDLLKTHLPLVSKNKLTTIADSIAEDAENVIHSMIKRAVCQEKENLYPEKKQ